MVAGTAVGLGGPDCVGDALTAVGEPAMVAGEEVGTATFAAHALATAAATMSALTMPR
jgi:hypothetical protein